MGELMSITIGEEDKKCCCGDMVDNDCCGSEEVAFEDGQADEIISSFLYQFDNSFFTTIELPAARLVVQSENKWLIEHLDLPPPMGEELYKINCSYIVYG